MTSFTADSSLLAGEPHDPSHPQQLADGYLPASMTPDVAPAPDAGISDVASY